MRRGTDCVCVVRSRQLKQSERAHSRASRSRRRKSIGVNGKANGEKSEHSASRTSLSFRFESEHPSYHYPYAGFLISTPHSAVLYPSLRVGEKRKKGKKES